MWEQFFKKAPKIEDKKKEKCKTSSSKEERLSKQFRVHSQTQEFLVPNFVPKSR